MMVGMTTWNDVHQAAPDLADLVRGRFEATGLGYLATLRRDGSPRVSGIEPLFADGMVWLGMMPQSRKALDLRHDPRLCLHAANIDKNIGDGDARISGVAFEHESEADLDRARAAFEAATGSPPPSGPMHLFSIDVTEAMFLGVGDDRLVIRTWTPAVGERHIERA